MGDTRRGAYSWCQRDWAWLWLSLCLLTAPIGCAQAADADAERTLFRQIYQELIEIDTTHSAGDTTRAARAMEQRLLDAGFAAADVQVLEPFPRKGNLVVRYRGSGEKRPMLLLSHLDVVEVQPGDWTGDPFELQESGGYFMARGSADDKARGAVLVSVLAQLKREGFVPKRDIILALTADEERGDVPTNGVAWLVQYQRPLIEAEFGLNEGADALLVRGKPWVVNVQLAEKMYVTYELHTSNPGGHSMAPPRANAINELAEALVRIAGHEFPLNLSPVTRAYFERMSAISTRPLASALSNVAREVPDEASVAYLSARPGWNAQLRTTCVVTMIEGGHAANALPQRAKATIICRLLPNDDAAAVERTLASLAGEKVTLKREKFSQPNPPSPMRPDVMGAIEKIAGQLWPAVPVVPVMSAGVTDSRFLRSVGIPMYGVSGLFNEAGEYRAHGRDERVLVRSLYESREFMYRLVRELSE